jgi:hypothetical protein
MRSAAEIVCVVLEKIVKILQELFCGLLPNPGALEHFPVVRRIV